MKVCHSLHALALYFAVDRRRERDRGIDRDRERERDRDRDRGHESREWERERDRDREREKRRPRSRSRSPVNDRHRRSASHDRTHKGADDRRDNRRERERSRERGYGGDSDRGRDRNDRKAVERRDKGESFVGIDGQRAAIVAEFVDGIASEQKNDSSPSVPPLMVDNDEEIMKKLGIPTGFNTTKVNISSIFRLFTVYCKV